MQSDDEGCEGNGLALAEPEERLSVQVRGGMAFRKSAFHTAKFRDQAHREVECEWHRSVTQSTK